MAEEGITHGEDGVARCAWAGASADYRAYHDTEWSIEPQSNPTTRTLADARAVTHTDESRALARDLKKRGWRFVGPTTVYAFMQAMGLVNDHLTGCDIRDEVEQARATLNRP